MAFSFLMCGYRFLSRRSTDRPKILHGGSATSRAGVLLFLGVASGMAESWASTGRRVVVYGSC